MEQREKELLDIYERFGKDAQGAMDFVRRNIGVGREPVEFDMTKKDDYMPVAVDLGLPSGVKWADRNVGATSPEEPGLFFSWGNVDGVEIGKACDFSEEAYAVTEGAKLKDNLDAAHDAATVNLGAPWRMPTGEEFQEMYDNCDWEWTTENGYYGVRFTSKINGKSIFFSASGYGYGSSWGSRGAYGYYWSASFDSARYARSLSFNVGGASPQNTCNRYYGFAVRPVQE